MKEEKQFVEITQDYAVVKETKKAVLLKFQIGEQQHESWFPRFAIEMNGTLKAEKNFWEQKLNGLSGEPKQKIENKEMIQETETVIDLEGINLKDCIKTFTEKYIEERGDAVIEKIVTPIIEQEVQKLRPTLITIGERKEIKLEGCIHKMFATACFMAQHKRQIFLSGPAGSGKTTLGAQVAKAFDLPFYHISCSSGLSEAHLLGRMLFNGDYISSEFVKAYETGGVFLFDEVDAADANTMLVINSALANGIISAPNRRENPTAVRHKDFICIAAANTWGAGGYEYHGRNYLDAAFLDRFVLSKIAIAYDTDLERDIMGKRTDLEVFWKIRANCEKHKVRKVVGTRAFSDGAIFLDAGATITQLLNTFVLGWSEEEIRKATEGISKTQYDPTFTAA